MLELQVHVVLSVDRERWGNLGLPGNLGLFAFSLSKRSKVENFDS